METMKEKFSFFHTNVNSALFPDEKNRRRMEGAVACSGAKRHHDSAIDSSINEILLVRRNFNTFIKPRRFDLLCYVSGAYSCVPVPVSCITVVFVARFRK